MLGNELESLSLTDLEELIADGVREGKTVEYKQDFYQLAASDQAFKIKQHEELLKDISSFANTVGGDLIIGMDEDKGVPTAVTGFDVADPDTLKRRIHQIVESGLEPRIGLSIHDIPLSPGQSVFVIRVRRSMLAPHRVVYRREFGQFWARNSGGAFRMDTSELRQAFTLTETINDRIESFRRDRVRAIINTDTPIPLPQCPKLVCHLVPLDSFASDVQLSPATMVNQLANLPLLAHTGGRSHRYNLDGVVVFDNSTPDNPPGYVQVFRTGIIESVTNDAVFSVAQGNVKTQFFSVELQEMMHEALLRYAAALSAFDVSAPVWVFLTLIGVKGVRILRQALRGGEGFDRECLILPGFEIKDLGATSYVDFLRPAFDMIWNAAGFERCHDYLCSCQPA